MMKKILFLFALVVSVSANASYLYWSVDSTTANGYGANQAVLWGSTTGDSYTIISASDIDTVTPSELFSVDSASYYIELYNYNNGTSTVVAKGGAFTYNDVVSYVSDSLVAGPNVWTTSTFYAPITPGGITPGSGPGAPVPEPTSAVMVLLGIAGLALKRKKV